MAYTKQNWQSGDTISATKLNHMEDGIAGGGGGGVLIVHGTISGDTMTLDHTWQEIHDALAVIEYREEPANITRIGWMVIVGIEDGVYFCDFIEQGGNTASFDTDNANGYPSVTK